ncbi:MULTISPECIES: DUF4190 domain-containing protein [Rhodanobacter]|uniref:DUF4190 domain-containing protein n=1 Tax=Rhodanobacter TaxID=75309 RepID=UPI0004237B01|nr:MULTISPECIES: DUF4190 domain-containing protein [Rhodanobacter]TAN19267.1 MAG: DUF4190 domain-containing protein [Rhodanobacter sp.]UJJ53837.1 DUF4190 domain-containing protein [Rhodanobacter thiooxydans]
MSYQPSYRPGASTSSLAVVSLVFGILAWCVLPFIGAIVAIICGHLARGEIRRSPLDARIEGDGMAVAGLVLGYVQLLLCVLAAFVLIAALIFGFTFANWH